MEIYCDRKLCQGFSTRKAQVEMAEQSPQTGVQRGAQAFEEGRLRRRVCADVRTSHAREPD